jgi:S1-C subfamily serine protease
VDTRNKEFRTLVVTLVIVLGLIVLSIYGSLVLRPSSWTDERLPLGAPAPASLPPGSAETLLSRIDEVIRPAVAYLETDGCDGQGRQRGSGLVVHADGFIVTNAHVVEGAEWVCVTLEGHARMVGVVHGANTATDLAVIKVETSEPLPTVVLGDSDALQVGEFVVAEGAPFGLRGSVSVGIISGLHRQVGLSAYEDFIVTDAAINRGNSGGPLVNLDGEVIGINTAIVTPNGNPHADTGYTSLGFAIPINVVKEVAGRLIGDGGRPRAEAAAEEPAANGADLESMELEVHLAHVVSEGADGTVLSRGSAFAISSQGMFLTNAHVVEAAAAVKVYTGTGGELTAEIRGQDPHTDLAVLSVASAAPMQDSPFADSDTVFVGEAVLALGSPAPQEILKTAASVTRVDVGGLGLATYQGLIQFDREIQPGSSGGPLLDANGRIIGVLTASGSGNHDAAVEGTGFGYAIPINLAREVAAALIAEGRVLRSYAGFGGVPAPTGISDVEAGGGVLVVDVEPGGPAERAGLERRDVIIESDGTPIRDNRTWQQNVLAQMPVGTTVRLTVVRGQEQLQIELTLDELPENRSEGRGD